MDIPRTTILGFRVGWGYGPERIESLVKSGVMVVLAIALPLIYLNIVYGSLSWAEIENRHTLHVITNAFVTLLCVYFAMSSRGRIATRMHTALVTTVMFHGALILSILLLRSYYSRPLIIIATMTSLVLATGLVLLSRRLRIRRIGIVAEGVTDELRSWAGGRLSTLITSPTAPVRQFDLILINFSAVLGPNWTKFAARAMLSGCEVRHAVEYVEERRGRVSPEHFEAEHAANRDLNHYVERYKRPLDLILCVASLVVVIPLLLVASAAIFVAMGRPILFKQERIGRGGRVFNIYKLRTMRQRLPSEPLVATAVNDPRITPVGRLLRRWRIDELPQLYNILKGEMSFIGPRPEQPGLAKRYGEVMPSFDYRHMLRPGITGWAQVQTGYAANDAETREKLCFDLYYIKYASWLLDLQILLRTILVLAGFKEVR